MDSESLSDNMLPESDDLYDNDDDIRDPDWLPTSDEYYNCISENTFQSDTLAFCDKTDEMRVKFLFQSDDHDYDNHSFEPISQWLENDKLNASEISENCVDTMRTDSDNVQLRTEDIS